MYHKEVNKMPKRGKNYKESAKLVDRSTLYDVNDAMGLTVQTAKAKFDETVEVHIKLGVDGRHADQQVRGAIVLPHGTGRLRKQKPRERIMWARKSWLQRFRQKTGLTLT